MIDVPIILLLKIIPPMMHRLVANNIQKFWRIRKLHTSIISHETIKPSSPTPPRLKTHNLSLIDFLSPNIHLPFVFFYKNYNTNGTVDINVLKKSLSQCLTQYYPFAGRIVTPYAPHIDCEDQGVEFLESSIPGRLDDFILGKHQDETLDLLIPNALGCAANKTGPDMAAIQLSHFTCGGVAVAVSVSHKIADGFTSAHFVNHWASLTRGGGSESLINPAFLSNPSISNFKIPEIPHVETVQKVNYATRRFVFPNTKLNELKNKINHMDHAASTAASRLNPTRVEALSSLLFKSAVTAATTKSGGSLLQPSSLSQMVNLRGRTGANFPNLAQGNVYGVVVAKIKDPSETELNEVITSVRKEIREVDELGRIREMEDVGKLMVDAWLTLMDDRIRSYSMTSLCWLPFYQADFGWGKPVRVMLRSGSVDANFVVLMDTPSGDGIEATVQLDEEEMEVFQTDKELLAYAQEI